MARRVYKRDASGKFATVGTKKVGKSELPGKIGSKGVVGGRLSKADLKRLDEAQKRQNKRQKPGSGYRDSRVQPQKFRTPAEFDVAAAKTKAAAQADTNRARQIQKQLAAGGMRPKDVKKAERSLSVINVRRMRREDQKRVNRGQNEKYGRFEYF
ncbi:hypothetical protein EBT31_11925 [bacterium]|nr:hypothetical protein [bacterium]